MLFGVKTLACRSSNALFCAGIATFIFALSGCGDPKQSFSQRVPAQAPVSTGAPVVTTNESRNRCEAATVPFGDSCNCETQNRSCTGNDCSPWDRHGDSWQAENCVVQAPASCTDENGTVIPHGGSQSRVAYPSSSVPAGSSCLPTAQSRSCSNGVLSGWTPSAGTNALSCTETRRRCENANVPYGSTCSCEDQFKVCSDGSCTDFSGHGDAWSATACSVGAPANCTDENGNTVPHGGSQSRSAYNEATPALGQSCVAVGETRTCSNGTLSPWNPSSPTILSCTESRERCETSSVPFGQTCNCETQNRQCSDGNCGGSWSGHGDSWSATACSVGAAKNCSDADGSANNGDTASRKRFEKEIVPAGESCQSESQSRTCNDGTFSPWDPDHYSKTSCSVCGAGTVPNAASTSCVSCASADASKPAWNSATLQCVSCESLDSTKPVWNGSACVSCSAFDSSKPIWDATIHSCKACDSDGSFGQALALPNVSDTDCKCENGATDPWISGSGDSVCRDCPAASPNFNTATGACANACTGGKAWTGTSCACPAGQQWFSGINHCAVPNTCSNGFTLDNATNACVCALPLQKFTRNGVDYCEAPVACDTAHGFDYDTVTNQCGCALPKEQINKGGVIYCEKLFCSDSNGKSGNGSASNPYLVCDSTSFDNIRYRSGSNFKQIKNIDLLNDSAKPFSCDSAMQATKPMMKPITNAWSAGDLVLNYDGQNYSISNFCYDSSLDTSVSSRSDIAIFPRLQRSVLQNMVLKNIDIKVSNGGGLMRIGGLASVLSNFSAIRNVQIDGKISGTATATNAQIFAGGLAYSMGASTESATVKTLQNITATVSVDLKDTTGTCKTSNYYTGGVQYLTEAAGVVHTFYDISLGKSMQNIVAGATRSTSAAQTFGMATLSPSPITVSSCASSGIVHRTSNASLAGMASYATIVSQGKSPHGWSGCADASGGILGLGYESDIKNAHAFIEIDSKGIECVGGVVGGLSNLNRSGVGITDSGADPLSTSSIGVQGGLYVGGVEGQGTAHFIRTSRSHVAVYAYPDAARGSYAGGVVGYLLWGVDITQAYSSAPVRIQNSAANQPGFNLGGVAGAASGTLRNVYATGSLSYAINPTVQSYMGGLFGYLQGTTTTVQFGHYRPANAMQLGGIVGRGGLVARKDAQATITNSYWDAQDSGQATDAGCAINDPNCVSLTPAQFRLQGSFAGWTFPTMWFIAPTANYPTLVDPAP